MRYGVILLLSITASLSEGWQDLTNVGPPVNTISYSEKEPALAQIGVMGAVMVFSSDRPGGYGDADLWGTKTSYIFWPWEVPVNLGKGANTGGWEGTPYFTHLDRKLYFSSDGPVGNTGARDIWWCWYWGYYPPEDRFNIGPPINTEANESHPVVSSEEDIIFFASDRAGGYGGYDIWMSTKSGGTWREPVNIGLPINTGGDDFPEWSAFKGGWYELVFSTGRAGGYGKNDFWYSWGYPGNWKGPYNFNTPVNSEDDDVGCCLYRHHNDIGGYMFFSTYGRPNGTGYFDLWSVTSYLSLTPTSLGQIKASWR